MKYFLLFLSLVAIVACTRTNSVDHLASNNRKPLSKAQIRRIGGGTDSVVLSTSLAMVNFGYARNIGEYFDKRLKFYKLDQPNLKIHQAPVSGLVMCFIDSTLAKIRYEVDEEVGSYLLDSLGMSKFKALDDVSKEMVKKRKIYDKYCRCLNPELKNYELIWRDESSVSRYKVKTYDSANVKYYFSQEMYGYKNKVRELERVYQIIDKNMPVLDDLD
ncbi:hypothetical protein [Fulvivirga ligni]|uniref:hypothetical protein n=1 Tax=Fulvivirga ligni TaxID=2904246 RepID=UPI001F38D3AE|nr:hypothetical protein [Fulvivirga ligni]UII20617.1 hypothetical protein LVD16_22505 [Fulvivirga ligni]